MVVIAGVLIDALNRASGHRIRLLPFLSIAGALKTTIFLKFC
jgi:hypothetical protein